MGRRGPKPKGNASKMARAARGVSAVQPKLPEGIPSSPLMLQGRGVKALYNDVFAALDRQYGRMEPGWALAVALLANAGARYLAANKELWAHAKESGSLFVVTTTGRAMKHPAVEVVAQEEKQIREHAKQLGLTPMTMSSLGLDPKAAADAPSGLGKFTGGPPLRIAE